MSKKDTSDLLKFLSPFSEEIIETVLWLREFAWDLYPKCNELILKNLLKKLTRIPSQN